MNDVRGQGDSDSVAGIAGAIRAGATTAVEVTRRALERIAALDPTLRAFVAVDGDRALARAALRDAEQRRGRVRGPLHGVPIGYKDLCVVRGLPTACGTGRRDYVTGVRDCEVARRLSRAGAITLGKLAMTPLAMGSFGTSGGPGAPMNPWAPDRVPGGSSSGCGVAVAAGLVPAAVGTDTGGSIRIPAACCGVVGLKPTYDRVSRAGVMPLAPSLDHVGPLARSAADLAVLLPAMVRGGARRHPATAREGLRGVRVGVADDPYFRAVDPEVAEAVATAAAILRDLGADVRARALPDPAAMMTATATIVRAEAAAAHGAWLDEAPEELDPLVRERLEEGRRLTATAYLHALEACVHLRRAFVREVFSAVDFVLAPVTPEAPVSLKETGGEPGRVAERMARWARFARLFNGLGIPVLALPAALSPDGVPLGVQIAGPPFADAALLDVGRAFERAAGWPRRPPGPSRAQQTSTSADR